MSSFYDTEPQPTASAIIHTTAGEIAVELFAKQTPLTCRNFLQHCLDGYYDDTIFHRLVPGFIVQGGDPTNSGHGGESIYDGGALSGDLDPWPMDERRGINAGPHGINFKDEFHTRLKFNRRGLLGMANESKPDTNGSQFFFTLDKTEELNGKNTMFGRVAGPTIFNLMKIAQGELQEGTERPLYVTKITHVEILTNPFADMKKRERDARKAAPSARADDDDDKKKKKRKKVDKKLLSFGDDVDDDLDGDFALPHKKAKTEKTEKKGKKAKSNADGPTDGPTDGPATSHQTTLPSRSLPEKPKTFTRKRNDDDAPSDSEDEQTPPPPKPKPRPKPMTALEKTNAEIAALKASMRRTVATEPERKEEKDRRSALEKLVPSDAARGKKLSRSNGLSNNDQRTIRMLGAFTSKLAKETSGHAPAKHAPQATKDTDATDAADATDGEVCDLHFILNCQSCRPWDKTAGGGDGDGDSDDDGDWMSHTLNCAADKLGKDLNYRKKAEEELIVIDPRERERNIKEDRKSSRDARGNGRSGRSWDQARHSKMSQASSFSGRGTK